jgi:hypothetical protein
MGRAFQTAKYMEKYAQIYMLTFSLNRARLVPDQRLKQQIPMYERLKTIDW